MELDQFQRAAVEDPAEQLLVEAPAGSGKTRVLVERVAWLVEHGHARPEQIAVVTFARKAAGELRERLAQRGLAGVTASTFHSWAFRLLRSLHTTSFRLVSDVERAEVLRRLIVGLARDARFGAVWRSFLSERNWSPTFAARELIQVLGSLRDFGRTRADLEQRAGQASSDQFVVVLAELWRRYEILLDRRGAFDFPLLVRRAAEQLRDWPAARGSPTGHLRHVLVDEAQDASPDDLALLDAATNRAARTWVGDPNQAIYAWRGAAPLAPGNVQRRALRCCYRSDRNLVALVNGYVRCAIGTDGAPAVAVRPAGTRATLLRHARYGEPAALHSLLERYASEGLRQSDVLVLARCHAPLERLAEVLHTFPATRFATVHAAKGLEARAVVVVGVSDDRFGFPLPSRASPHQVVRTLATYDQAAEELRLFYVALTRARDQLVLLADAERPSSLLPALPRRLLQRATMQKLHL